MNTHSMCQEQKNNAFKFTYLPLELFLSENRTSQRCQTLLHRSGRLLLQGIVILDFSRSSLELAWNFNFIGKGRN